MRCTMATAKPDEWVVIIDSENDTVMPPSSDSSSNNEEAEALACAILQASDTDAILLKSSEHSQHSQHSQHSVLSASDHHILNKLTLSSCSSSLAVKAQTVLLCLIITHCFGSIIYLRYMYTKRATQTP